MTWPANAEKVFKILAKKKGDAEGWVEMNEALKKAGLTKASDIRFAFYLLTDRARKWVESVPDHSRMELSIWGPHKEIMTLENTKIKARLTQLGKDELQRRKRPSQWAAWIGAVSGAIAAIVALTMLIEQKSSQSIPEPPKDGTDTLQQTLESPRSQDQRPTNESVPPNSLARHSNGDSLTSKGLHPTMSFDTLIDKADSKSSASERE